MQENGKLFSFLVITPLLMALSKPERAAIYRTTEKYIDTINTSVKIRDSVLDADISRLSPSISSFTRTEMF
jgi:hypothetical protein